VTVTALDNRRTALERAFELANSGVCSSFNDLQHCLKLEGYSLVSVEGYALHKQLRAIIHEQRSVPSKGATPASSRKATSRLRS
jgi:hypothetical protein